MISCEQILARINLYLDDELRDGEQAIVESHIADCKACHDTLHHQRQLVEGVRRLRPLHQSTPELRSRVKEILNDAPAPYAAPPELRRRIQKSLWQTGAKNWTAQKIAAVAVLAVFAAWGIIAQRNLFRERGKTKPLSDFALKAVDTHNRHQGGVLPLEIISDSPEVISGWFAGKVSFSLKLPNYQESSGQEKLYNLEGARLIAFRNDYAAYVSYEMNHRPISLVVTSFDIAQPSGGEEISSKGLTFHYDSVDGLKVITWADRGLTYALVSDLAERGQQSCMVCHIGTKDRNFIEDLKPKLPEN
jgi:anti-sigma factor RsiW